MPIILNGTTGDISGSSLTGIDTGKILQVKQVEKTDTWSTNADFSFVDVTGLAVTITPSSSSSKILVLVDVLASSDYWVTYFKLLRGSTEIGNTATGKQSNQGNYFSTYGTNATDSNANGYIHHHTRQILDSPNTTSATTYKLQSTSRAGSYNAYVNRTVPDRNDNEWLKHSIASIDESGIVEMSYRKVILTTLTDEVEAVPPKKRVY